MDSGFLAGVRDPAHGFTAAMLRMVVGHAKQGTEIPVRSAGGPPLGFGRIGAHPCWYTAAMPPRKPPSLEDTTQVVRLSPEQRRALQEPHVLRQVSGPGSPRTFPLLSERLTIGRAPTSDICIDSQQISRSHAVLERTPEGFTCRDLDSANGVWVDGVKVVSAVLRDDDTLQVGDVVFEYHEN